MAKGREFYTEYPENPPDRYWKGGLHDSCILGAWAYEFSFDSRVKEIRFYNYKILPESIDLTGKSKYHNNQERNDE